MSRTAVSIAFLMAATLPLALSRGAQAQPAQGAPDYYPGEAEQAPDQGYAQPAAMEQEGPPPPIPAFVDAPPTPAPGGGFCFDGPHPVDSRVEPGMTWDGTQGRHIHGYPPFDLRLFSFQNGCYYFIGDPTDFGYVGQSYSYYGAHPILATYGGGWCFMVGPHRHFWRPWSSLFVSVGPWYYWEGPYDPFFWTYWPYYHFYYRNHYPHYYSHGAFFRGHMAAPRITSVPRPMGYGRTWGSPGFRGAPGSPGFRAAPVGPRAPGAAPGFGRAMPMAPRGPGAGPGAGPFRAAPVMPGPSSGGFRAAPMAPRAPAAGPSGGYFRSAPAAPSGGFAPRSFSAPHGGGGGGAHFGGGHFGGGGGRFRR